MRSPPVRAFDMARGLLPVTPRLPSPPLAAGRLRMTSGSDFIVHLALLLGKCQNKVQPACIIGTVPRVGISSPG